MQVKRKKMLLALSSLVLVLGLGVLYWMLGAVRGVVAVEAGQPIPAAAELVRFRLGKAVYADQDYVDSIDTSISGEYTVKVRSLGLSRKVVLRVGDSTPPAADPVARVGIVGLHTFAPEDFVKNIRDASPVTASFVQPYDPDKAGPQLVSVALEDPYGNRSQVDAELRLLRLREPLQFELGQTPDPLTPEMLFEPGNFAGIDMRFAKPPAAMKSPGEQKVTLLFGGEEVPLTLKVADTTPPQAKTKDKQMYLGNTARAMDFIAEIIDASKVEARFAKQPNFRQPGTQAVEIELIDEGKNKATVTATLTILEDNEPPKINGVHEFHIAKYGTVAYRKGVSVTDNSGSADLSIDTHKVNTNVPGEYEVVYTARDAAGNVTRETTLVVVSEVSKEAVDALVNPILRKIISAGMSDYNKARAIHGWILRSITYVNTGQKNGVLDGAYNAMILRRGDCYTFYALAKYMLEAEGIDSVDMRRVAGAPTRHFWLALDFGNGYYHFDASPGRNKPNGGFMMTETQAKNYGVSVGRPYYYDYVPVSIEIVE